MRKKIGILLLAMFVLIGCTVREEKEHPDWDASWFALGDLIAAETPEGFTLNESNDVLSIAGLYYATWTAGQGEPITNAQGKDAVLYDAQIYLLVKECESAEDAETDIADWMQRETGAYETVKSTVTAAGHSYTALELVRAKNENPYHHGAAAFGVIGTNAVSAELLCREGWDGDVITVLTEFLNGLHD